MGLERGGVTEGAGSLTRTDGAGAGRLESMAAVPALGRLRPEPQL